MADDLKLAVVIEALLNAKGFEDAKASLRNIADTAGAAAPKTKAAGDAAKKMGESYGGTRGPVADLTRLLLLNTGVTGGAGEAAKAAGEAMYFMEGAATASTAAISAGVALLAVGLPLLIRWATATEDQKDQQTALKEEIDKTLPILERYAAQAKVLTESARLQLAAGRNKTLREEAIETEHLKDETEVLGRIQQQQLAQGMILWPKDIENLEKKRGRLMDLQEAQRQSITVEELYERRIKAETDAHEAATEAARKRAEQQDALNKAIQEGIEGQSETRLRGIQDLIKKDSDRIAEREKNNGQGQLSPELMQRLTEIDLEKQAEQDLADYEAETQRQIREARQETAIATVGYIGQTLSALSDAFGGNKALAIAGAIIDTYAGAAAALGPKGPPWPANLAAAASIIATGLAHVQQIRKAHPEGIGFDDPFADLTARQLGRRSAQDFARHFGREFVGMLPGEMERQTVNHYSTRIDRSTTYNLGGINGLMANSPTAFARGLDRALNKTDRFRSRTTLGR